MNRMWLKKLREKRKWSQKKVAEKLEMTNSYYCLIENGQRKRALDVVTAGKIAYLFNIPVERVLRYESSMAKEGR